MPIIGAKTPRTITFEVLAGNPPSKIAYSPFFDSSATVLCYPNPSGSVFYFDIAAQNSQKIELLIYDSNSNEVAKIMHSTNPGENTTLFWDASHLKNGIYFYKYFLSDDVVSGKLILFR